PFTAGLTYNAHPVGVAAAIACIKEYKRLGTREHVLELEPYLKEKLAKLKEKHISVGDVRSIGLFGAIEFSHSKEERQPITEGKNGQNFLQEFLIHLRDQHGILTFGGGSHILVAPPLITSKEELDEIFDRLDQAIEYVDELV
ncbi:MAG: aminotransferase class III-fold pyridoxal phosphate-dependent enzyme, partial [Eubacterium sp.]|nr:aminotransferase class III-fold pyridoxal phosphate-dependent enzyme [Eubacterium sp.]